MLFKPKLERWVNENCFECTFTVTELHIPFFSLSSITLEDPHFHSGQRGSFEVIARAERVTGRLNLSALWQHQIVLSRLEFDEPDVRLVDGDKPSPPPPKEAESENPYTFAIEQTEARLGHFTYVRDTHGTSAQLNIHDIHLLADGLGNVPELKKAKTKAEAHLQIEKSGDIHLTVEVPVFVKPLAVDVRVKVLKQNLEDLTPFFKANAGVNLKGFMVEGLGTVAMRGSKLNARVEAKYEGFALHLDKMYDRSAASAFFTNLGTSIIMKNKNLDKDLGQRRRVVNLEREGKESIVSFILRGLKEAAIEVAEAHTSETTHK